MTTLLNFTSPMGEAMIFLRDYAMKHRSINMVEMVAIYIREGHQQPIEKVIDECVIAGYVRRTLLPQVLTSNLTPSGKFLVAPKPLTAVQLIAQKAKQ